MCTTLGVGVWQVKQRRRSDVLNFNGKYNPNCSDSWRGVRTVGLLQVDHSKQSTLQKSRPSGCQPSTVDLTCVELPSVNRCLRGRPQLWHFYVGQFLIVGPCKHTTAPQRLVWRQITSWQTVMSMEGEVWTNNRSFKPLLMFPECESNMRQSTWLMLVWQCICLFYGDP